MALDDAQIWKLTQEKISEEEAEFRRTKSDIPNLDVIKQLHRQEDGDANLFVKLFKDRFVFDHATKTWFQWGCHHWLADRTEEALVAIDQVVALYDREAQQAEWRARQEAKASNNEGQAKAEQLRKTLLGRISALQHIQRKKHVLDLAAAGRERLALSGEEWDSNPWLLGVANGVIDLREGKLYPGNTSDYIKTASPTMWEGIDAPCPTWRRFLVEIFKGDEELISYLQRLLGYSITGITTEHVFPILWGEGRNGKGTLLETLAHVLGPLAGPVKAELLLVQDRSRNSAAPDSDIMALRGRRLAWASETGEGRKLDIGKVKWLTGGDTLVGRAPHAKHEVTFKATHHLFLLTNHKPKADPSEFALWERVVLMPFELRYRAAGEELERENDRSADPDLPKKLQAENSGILAWLAQGCLDWQKYGLRKCSTVKAATREYRASEDVLAEFISSECYQGPQASVRAGAFYKGYEQWCQRTGAEKLSLSKVGAYVKTRFHAQQEGGGYWVYKSIGLLKQEEYSL